MSSSQKKSISSQIFKICAKWLTGVEPFSEGRFWHKNQKWFSQKLAIFWAVCQITGVGITYYNILTGVDGALNRGDFRDHMGSIPQHMGGGSIPQHTPINRGVPLFISGGLPHHKNYTKFFCSVFVRFHHSTEDDRKCSVFVRF